MKRIFLTLALLLCTAPSFAQDPVTVYAGATTTCTATSGTATIKITRSVNVKTGQVIATSALIAWKSTTAGSVKVAIPFLSGTIERVVTKPIDSPTDNLDETLLDAQGADLFATLGTDRDTANTEQFAPKIGNGTGVNGLTTPGGTASVMVNGTSTFQVLAAGSAKSGQTCIYLK